MMQNGTYSALSTISQAETLKPTSAGPAIMALERRTERVTRLPPRSLRPWLEVARTFRR